MHDINFIRENPSLFDEGLKKRFIEPQSQRILDLDTKKRELLTKSQDLRSERKNLSSEFSKLNEEEKSSLQIKVQNIKNQIEDYIKKSDDFINYVNQTANIISESTFADYDQLVTSDDDALKNNLEELRKNYVTKHVKNGKSSNFQKVLKLSI